MEKEKKTLATRIDDAIGLFSPKRAYARKRFRAASSVLQSYNSARTNRLRKNWLVTGGSADYDILEDLKILRERSRDLNRNDGYASGITKGFVNDIIGTGILPQSRVDRQFLGISDKRAEEYQRSAERCFRDWAKTADITGALDFQEVQKLAMKQVIENGEIFIVRTMKQRIGRKYEFCLQLVEADRVDTPTSYSGNKNIRKGIELDDEGIPIAYYIRKGHPGDYNNRVKEAAEYERVPARRSDGKWNVIHLYEKDRPGQSKGVPWFASIMTDFKDLSDYDEAELTAARVAACFSLFVTTENPQDMAANWNATKQSDGSTLTSLEPGMIEHLAPGENIQSFNPQRPSSTYEAFVVSRLRKIAASQGLPYEVVAKDYTKTNYSSARAALLGARRYFGEKQSWIARKLCHVVWEEVLNEAFIKGYLDHATTFLGKQAGWSQARWIPQGWQWVDPLKEVKASQVAMEIGVTSLADECASQGKDYEEVLDQIVREKKMIKTAEQENDIKLLGPVEQEVVVAPVPGQEEGGVDDE